MVNFLREVQLSADYLQGDETRSQVHKEPGMDPTRLAISGSGCFGGGGPLGKPVVLCHYDKSRTGSVADELLDGFQGRYYQSDG